MEAVALALVLGLKKAVVLGADLALARSLVLELQAWKGPVLETRPMKALLPELALSLVWGLV